MNEVRSVGDEQERERFYADTNFLLRTDPGGKAVHCDAQGADDSAPDPRHPYHGQVPDDLLGHSRPPEPAVQAAGGHDEVREHGHQGRRRGARGRGSVAGGRVPGQQRRRAHQAAREVLLRGDQQGGRSAQGTAHAGGGESGGEGAAYAGRAHHLLAKRPAVRESHAHLRVGRFASMYSGRVPGAHDLTTLVEGTNTTALLEELAAALPEGPMLFPSASLTDRPERYGAALGTSVE
eukprot:scaffold843_cov255-Pinguiococcus_pyrenoidosus.AAC.11